MEENKMTLFTNEELGNVRALEIDGEPYFVGKDVAVALGYAKPENAISAHVDQEDKTTTLIQGDGSNYKSKTTLINESGLYSLILSSKLPKAKSSSVNEEHKSFLYLFLLYSYLHLLLYLLLSRNVA